MCTYVDSRREGAVRKLANAWAASPAGVVGAVRGHGPEEAVTTLAGCGARCEGARVLVVDAFWVHSYSSHRVVYRQTRRLAQAMQVCRRCPMSLKGGVPSI